MGYTVWTAMSPSPVRPGMEAALLALAEAHREGHQVVEHDAERPAVWVDDLRYLHVENGLAEITPENDVPWGGGQDLALALSDYLEPGATLYSKDSDEDAWAYRIDGPGRVARLEGRTVYVEEGLDLEALRAWLEGEVAARLGEHLGLAANEGGAVTLARSVLEVMLERLEPGPFLALKEGS